MAGKPSRALLVVSRRQRVSDLYLQGWSQAAIAQHLGYSQATICNDVKQINRQWRESAVRDFDQLRTIEALKIDCVEREAWAGWERSQQPQQTATIKGEGGPGQKASKTMKSRVGDPRFLDVVARCSAHRRELLGLDLSAAAVPLPTADANGEPLSIDDQRGQLLAMIQSMKERARQAEETQQLESPVDEVIDVHVSPLAEPNGHADGAIPAVNGHSVETLLATPS